MRGDLVRIALVDDDLQCLEQMTALIRDFSRQQNCRIDVDTFQDAESFLSAGGAGTYAGVFMDIYLGNGGADGIEAARRLRELDSSCLAVFLTSSEDHMPSAFSCHAFEYIVKPFSEERVFTVLKDMLAVVPEERSFIELHIGRGTVPVLEDDIVSAVSEAHYLRITLEDGREIRPRMTMREFQQLLGGNPRFLLINKGVMVNADNVVKFVDNACVLSNGAWLPVRVRSRQKIEQAVRDYNFARLRSRQNNVRK